MTVEADRLREFFSHNVTDDAAEKLDEMEDYIDQLKVNLSASSSMLSMLSKDPSVMVQIELNNKLIKGN